MPTLGIVNSLMWNFALLAEEEPEPVQEWSSTNWI